MNIDLINLCNQFDLTNADTIAVPEGLKLESLLEENRELKKGLKELVICNARYKVERLRS